MHMLRYDVACGFLSDSAVTSASATSLRVAKRIRWRLLGMALVAWRADVLHNQMIAEMRRATTKCSATLRELRKKVGNIALPKSDRASHAARRDSLVFEARDARERWNKATGLLQRVAQTRGHRMWAHLRGRACLFYFHVMRRLELRLTELDAPPEFLRSIRKCAMLLANSAEKVLGDDATKGMSMRELRIDPFGLTPRIRCDHKIPRMSVVSGR